MTAQILVKMTFINNNMSINKIAAGHDKGQEFVQKLNMKRKNNNMDYVYMLRECMQK